MRSFLPQTKKNENGRTHGEWKEAIRPENHHYANEQVIRVFRPSIYRTTPKIFYLHTEKIHQLKTSKASSFHDT